MDRCTLCFLLEEFVARGLATWGFAVRHDFVLGEELINLFRNFLSFVGEVQENIKGMFCFAIY